MKNWGHISITIFFMILLVWLSIPTNAKASDIGVIPVSYEGRFMPAGSYAKKWMYQITHKDEISETDLNLFQTSQLNALNFLWQLHFHGHVGTFEDQSSSQDKEWMAAFEKLRKEGTAPKQIALLLEQHFPLRLRLKNSGSLLKFLPGKFFPGEWYSLHALKIKSYNPLTGNLELADNFTVYDNELFSRLRHSYEKLAEAAEKNLSGEIDRLTGELAGLLKTGYRTIASKPYLQASEKQLTYPSERQLYVEMLYSTFPFILVCIGGYALALLLLSLGYLLLNSTLKTFGICTLTAAFLIHGSLLAMRSYILGRPPVSNMFETLLYVPWVSVLTGLLLWLKYHHTMLMIAGAAASTALLTLLQMTQIDASFSNVQAVLDSQYWLIIHVLLVVGSYGIFILSGILGHFYLAGIMWRGHETAGLAFLAQLIVQTMYIGVALLVPGTLLGGVWAAESWGRFWDWDPKEAWAFISICIYLIWIHAYRFHKIGHFGLAIGSIAGLLAVSFTWYGVNYILGTGLHSYGFGNGGERYYYGYVAVEILLILLAQYRKRAIV